MAFAATWMDLEVIMLNEITQTVRYTHHMLSLIYGILKKKDTMNLFSEQKETQRLWKTYGYQMRQVGGAGGGEVVMYQGFGMEDVLKLGCKDGCTTINTIKLIEFKKL